MLIKSRVETHSRTLTKTVIYRLSAIVLSMIISLSFGGTIWQALQFSAFSLIVGSTHYYIYDRLWLLVKWQRVDSVDTHLRTLVKFILYRCTVFLVMLAISKVVFVDTLIAVLVATTKFFLNSVNYYILERIFTHIGWGKIKEDAN